MLCTTFGRAQDIHFSQTIRSEFQINPAFTGAFSGNLRGTINWKDQWQAINKSFRTYAASGEISFGKGRRNPTFFALGAYAFRDVSGDVQLGNTSAGLSFNTLLRVNRNARFCVALNGNYTSTGLNSSNMQWGSQYDGINFDPSLANGEGIEFAPQNFFDASFGIAYWYNKRDRNVVQRAPYDAKIGFSVFHLNRPRYSYFTDNTTRVPMRMVLHADGLFGTKNQNLFIYPNLTLVKQGPQHELLMGTLWKYSFATGSKSTGLKTETSIAMGADIRITNIFDAIVPQIYFQMYSMSIGLSYDINVSRLNQASNYRGGFELSLRFTNPDHYTHRNPFRRSVSI